MSKRISIFLIALFFLSINTAATVYKSPKTYGVFSENTEFMSRIIPAWPVDDKYKPYAKAEIYQLNGNTYELKRTFHLLNEVSPQSAYLSNEGVLVTMLDWANPFAGHDLVIYSVTGKVSFEFSGLNFFSESELKKIQDVGSDVLNGPRPWICWQDEPFQFENEVFEFTDSTGRYILIDVNTGKHTTESSGIKCGE
ncbi:hypothetical protein ACG1BZ_13760 [Microbulbifer sp. CNSA002]|uniref:hypothetical protein n=1 Tax=Microbulbifer sp. CNSA002 TaxID=3373604 RepID=UPI0039B5C326